MKKVTYNNKEYKVEFSEYGYSQSKLAINGEIGSRTINNDNIHDVEVFSRLAKEAIKEYEARISAQNKFKEWDGIIH